MAYKLEKEDLGYKVFEWPVGERRFFYMKTATFNFEQPLRCQAFSRLTGAVLLFNCNDQGSNSNYVSIQVPELPLEKEGFLFKVQKQTDNGKWITIGVGQINPLYAHFTSA